MGRFKGILKMVIFIMILMPQMAIPNTKEPSEDKKIAKEKRRRAKRRRTRKRRKRATIKLNNIESLVPETHPLFFNFSSRSNSLHDSSESNIDKRIFRKSILIIYHVFKRRKVKFVANQSEHILKVRNKYKKRLDLFQVDCDRYSEFCNHQQVENYPSLQLIKEGESFFFKGRYRYKEIHSFVKKYIKKSMTYIKDMEALNKIRDSMRPSEVGLLYVGTKKALRYKVFKKFDLVLKQQFYYTFNSTIRKTLAAKKGDYFIFGKRRLSKFRGKASTAELEASIFGFRYPHLMRPGKEFRTRIFMNEYPAVVFFSLRDSPKIFRILEKVARHFHVRSDHGSFFKEKTRDH